MKKRPDIIKIYEVDELLTDEVPTGKRRFAAKILEVGVSTTPT
jgi:hypothetical protein